MKHWILGLSLLLALSLLTACKNTENISLSSESTSLEIDSSSTLISTSDSAISNSGVSTEESSQTPVASVVESPVISSESSVPSTASQEGSTSSSRSFSGREDGVKRLGVYYNGSDDVYWLTSEETTGFMRLFEQLQYGPSDSITDVPAGASSPGNITIEKEDGDKIIVTLAILGIWEQNSTERLAFDAGQEEKQYALAQYLYSLESIQNISELKDLGATIVSNLAARCA